MLWGTVDIRLKTSVQYDIRFIVSEKSIEVREVFPFENPNVSYSQIFDFCMPLAPHPSDQLSTPNKLRYSGPPFPLTHFPLIASKKASCK